MCYNETEVSKDKQTGLFDVLGFEVSGPRSLSVRKKARRIRVDQVHIRQNFGAIPMYVAAPGKEMTPDQDHERRMGVYSRRYSKRLL